MFRITCDENSGGVHMRVEGRLGSQFADVAKELIFGRNLHVDLVVDLSEVSYADSGSEEALRWLRSLGAKFVADSSYSLHLCERLQLPVSAGLS
jgi:hypothetical protein